MKYVREFLILIVALLILISGCAVEKAEKCGDGVCDEVEKQSGLCPKDCKEEPTTPTTEPTTTEPITTGKYWAKAFGGDAGLDYAPSVLVEEDGYVVVGYTSSFGAGLYDLFVVKISENGNIFWAKVIGGKKDDKAYAISKANDGGYVISGLTSSFEGGMFVVKLDSEGEFEWAKAIGDETGRSYSLIPTRDGYLVFGSIGNPEVTTSSFLVMLDNNGNFVSGRTILGSGGEKMFGLGATKTIDEGYAIIGNIAQSTKQVDNFIIKLDKNLNIEWGKAVGGDGIWAANWDGIRQTSDGGYIYAVKRSSGAGEDDFMAVKLDSNGNLEWNNAIDGGGSDAGWSIAEADDGYITGGKLGRSHEDPSMEDAGDIPLIKLDREGKVAWAKVIDASENGLDEIEEVIQIDEGYILVGLAGGEGPNSKAGDFFVGKVDKSGTIENCENIKELSLDDLESGQGKFSIVSESLKLEVSDIEPQIDEATPAVLSVSPEIIDVELEVRDICVSQE